MFDFPKDAWVAWASRSWRLQPRDFAAPEEKIKKLPPKVATAEHRVVVQAMLKVKGVNFAKAGAAVRLTQPR